MPAPPLIAARWRGAAESVIVAGAGVAFALGVLTFHATSTPLDGWVVRVLREHTDAWTRVQLLGFTNPPLSVALLAAVVLAALVARRWNLAVLAVLGPTLGVVLTSDILKPIVHRTLPLAPSAAIGHSGVVGSYPSGHETGVTCTALVVFVAVCHAAAHVPWGRRARVTAAAVLLAWVVTASIALTAAVYHYWTDTVGAVGVSSVVVLGLALALDRLPARRPLSSPDVPDRSSRAPAA